MTQHVVVIGAGIVGASCALELLRDGNRVTIIEPGEPGGEQYAAPGKQDRGQRDALAAEAAEDPRHETGRAA